VYNSLPSLRSRYLVYICGPYLTMDLVSWTLTSQTADIDKPVCFFFGISLLIPVCVLCQKTKQERKKEISASWQATAGCRELLAIQRPLCSLGRSLQK